MHTQKLNLHDKLPLTCTRSGTCCHGKNVNLNPWELHCLAKEKGLTTREFRDLYTEFGGVKLRFDGKAGWNNQAACSQYVEGFGCDVHLGRPLACRLYPLGRQKQGYETFYIYQGSEFPCLVDGCPDVVNLPQLSVADYMKGQASMSFEIAQDEYLEVMKNLADVAFMLLLETGLSESEDIKTLQVWRKIGHESVENLVNRINPEWLDLLMLPDFSGKITNSVAFAHQHNELLQEKIQTSFGSLSDLQSVFEACCLLMSMALHLGRGLGATPSELADHWISIAIEYGARE